MSKYEELSVIWPTILDQLPAEIPSIYFKGPVAIWLPSSVLPSDEQSVLVRRNSPTLTQILRAISAFYWQEVNDEEIAFVAKQDARFSVLLRLKKRHPKQPIYRHQLMGDRIGFGGLVPSEADDGYRLCLKSY